MFVLRKIALVASWSLTASMAQALVIDDFTDGLLLAGPEETNLATTQSGLDPTTVAGGSRDLFALYGGSWEIGQGAWRVEHDRSFFEVVNLRWGAATDPTATPLNLDATAGGAEQLLIRFSEVTALGDQPAAVDLSMSFVSRDGDEVRSGGIGIGLPESAVPYTIAIDTDDISSFNGFSLTDIDGAGISLFLSGKMRVVIESIEFSTLVPGDLNADGFVNEDDLDSFAAFYGKAAPVAADANRDGIVDAADYTVWRDAMAALTPAAVPEPGTGGLLLLVIAGGWLMRNGSVR